MKVFIFGVWISFAIFMFGFSVGRHEACGTPVANPIAYLAWPLAAIALASGAEIEEQECNLKG